MYDDCYDECDIFITHIASFVRIKTIRKAPLSLLVISGTIDLASRLGTNEHVNKILLNINNKAC